MEAQRAFDSENNDYFVNIPEPELVLKDLSKKTVQPDDYSCFLKHEYGDNDLIPESLLKEIRNFVETEYMPAVFKYLGNIYPQYHRYSLSQVEENGFCVPPLMEDTWDDDDITRELAYDLTKTEGFLTRPDTSARYIIQGRRAIGSVMRICKAIGKQELADNIFQVVKNCFNPDEHPDRKDNLRELFGLDVERSTGKI